MNIGIVGSGKIGGVVGKLWARAGHHVRFSSRHPERLDALAAEAGPNASRGTIAEALAFGDVILLSRGGQRIQAWVFEPKPFAPRWVNPNHK